MLLSYFGRRTKVRRLPGITALLVLPAFLLTLSGYLLASTGPTMWGEGFVELVETNSVAVARGSLLSSAPGAPVTIVVGGEEREVAVAKGATVEAVLHGLDLELDQDDRVAPSLTSKVDEDTEIVVQRVSTTVEVRQIVVPPPVLERRTTDLPEGSRREVSEGQDGTTHVIEEVTWVDGVVADRVRTEERVVSEPEARIVEIGIASDDEDTDSDADREAGTDEEVRDDIVSSALEHIQTGGASWYVYGTEFTAAHRTLPKGTMVTVTNLENGKTVNVRINDRGPYITGRVIDLNKVAFEELASPSQGVIDVRISW